MNATTLTADVFRATLLSKAAQYREKLQDARHNIVVETAAEPIDQNLLTMERERAVEEMEDSYRLLRQIEAALSRMERGKYGICLKCGEEIQHKRLGAVPWTLFCLSSQQAVNLLQHHAKAFRKGNRRAA